MDRSVREANRRLEGIYSICTFISFASINLYIYYSNVQATVLLNANVAFLAIQSVDSASTLGHRSFAQRASYFSIVTSVGAIVLGLLLAREHNISLNVRRIF